VTLPPLPWIETAVVLPLVAAAVVRCLASPQLSRNVGLLACGLTLACSTGGWLDAALTSQPPAARSWLFPDDSIFLVDDLNAPLFPLVSLLYLLTLLATLGSKVRQLSFSLTLVSLAILLATLACGQPWVLIALLAIGTLPPFVELVRTRQPSRMFALHMLLFVGLLVAGQALFEWNPGGGATRLAGVTLLAAAVLVRSGILPAHCWLPDLFGHASFGTALLFVTPMVGAYAAMRLVFPFAPETLLHGMAVLSLVTAVYAAGMALVQRKARRLFSYLLLSLASLVFVGFEMVTPVGVTATLCTWISVALSMAGFGLTLRSIETRTGPLSLDTFHGLFVHTPRLAALFLITGLASIGFPGTVGFIGTELLIDGAVHVAPWMGIMIVIAAALNGLAVLHTYFRVFSGTRSTASIDLTSRPPERIAVLVLSALIIGGGLFPQPGIVSRYETAVELVEQRAAHQPQAARTARATYLAPSANLRGEHARPARDETGTRMDRLHELAHD